MGRNRKTIMEKEGRIITEEEAYAKMARICSRKEYAPSDISLKLRRLNISEALTDKIIDRLRKEKYIDEKRFIRSYINDKIRFNKWGKKKISVSLRRKQFPQEWIDEAFSEFSGDLFGESLQPLLEKKWKSVKGKSVYEKRGKLIRYALGKGFSFDEAITCIEKMRIGGAVDETE